MKLSAIIPAGFAQMENNDRIIFFQGVAQKSNQLLSLLRRYDVALTAEERTALRTAATAILNEDIPQE